MSVRYVFKNIAIMLARIFLAAVPAIVTIWLVQYYFNSDLRAFFPAYDADQCMYIREAKTFAAAGFDGGYYGLNGQTAKVGRFGPHGAAYPILYGGLARLFGGWQDWLAPVFNLGFVSLALLILGRRLSLSRLAGIVAFIVTFSSSMIYLPLSYQEALQYAVAMVLALVFSLFFNRLEKGSSARWRNWGALGVVLLASLTRPTWAVLFPAAVYCGTPGRRRDILYAAVLGGGLLFFAYALFAMTATPWNVPTGPGVLIALLHGDLDPLISPLVANMTSLLDFTNNANSTLGLAIMLGGTLLAMAIGKGMESEFQRRNVAIHLCNMFFPVAIYIAIYAGTGNQLNRLISAHFLLSLTLAMLVAPRRAGRLVLGPVLAGCLAMLPATLASYTAYVRPAYDDYLGWRDRIDGLGPDLSRVLQVAANAPSPWLRTLIVYGDDAALAYLAAPAEFGIQGYDLRGLETPFRAGFALLDPAGYAAASQKMPLTPLAKTPHGVLYRNDVAFGFAAAAGAQP